MPEINQDRLRLLESKERAHDDYMAAIRATRAVAARYELSEHGVVPPLLASYSPPMRAAFVAGYRRALRDLEEGIVLADRERHAEMVDATSAG